MSTEDKDLIDAREEWINSFSGLEGRGSIGRKLTPIESVNFSQFVMVAKTPIGTD